MSRVADLADTLGTKLPGVARLPTGATITFTRVSIYAGPITALGIGLVTHLSTGAAVKRIDHDIHAAP